MKKLNISLIFITLITSNVTAKVSDDFLLEIYATNHPEPTMDDFNQFKLKLEKICRAMEGNIKVQYEYISKKNGGYYIELSSFTSEELIRKYSNYFVIGTAKSTPFGIQEEVSPQSYDVNSIIVLWYKPVKNWVVVAGDSAFKIDDLSFVDFSTNKGIRSWVNKPELRNDLATMRNYTRCSIFD